MLINLELTDNQKKYLKQFAKNQHEGAADNLGTHKPLHLVQTKVEHYTHGIDPVLQDGYFDYVVYAPAEDRDIVFATPAELIAHLKDEDECNDPEVLALDPTTIGDYLENIGFSSSDCILIGVSHTYETKSFHFTLAEARRYMQYQSHNLHKPRTYTVSPGYSNNGDYEPIFDFLMTAGKELLKLEDPSVPKIRDFYIGSDNGSGIRCNSKEEFLSQLSDLIDQAALDGAIEQFDIHIS